jgi:GTP-binding protein Era
MGVHRTGFVALVGRPNVGKSTLLNRMLGAKLSIVSRKPQTTRNRILGVYHTDDLELALVDTPGLHEPRNLLGRRMVEQARAGLQEVDAVVWLIDPAIESDPDHPQSLLPLIVATEKPVVLAPNKIDLLPKHGLLPLLERYAAAHGFAALVPVSAKHGDGVEALVSELRSLMPEGPPLFGRDVLTDRSERFLVAELVREKLVRQTGQELPYTTAVQVEGWEEEASLVRIAVRIVVERKSQKAIVIGKGGHRIKRIGIDARRDIEGLLGCKVFLVTHVAVDPGWSQKASRVDRFGNFR